MPSLRTSGHYQGYWDLHIKPKNTPAWRRRTSRCISSPWGSHSSPVQTCILPPSSLPCKNAGPHSCLNEVNITGMSTCSVSLHLQKQRGISLLSPIQVVGFFSLNCISGETYETFCQMLKLPLVWKQASLAEIGAPNFSTSEQCCKGQFRNAWMAAFPGKN